MDASIIWEKGEFCVFDGMRRHFDREKGKAAALGSGLSVRSIIVEAVGIASDVHAVDTADNAIHNDEQDTNHDGDNGQDQTHDGHGVLQAGITGLLHADGAGDDTADGAEEGKHAAEASAGAGAGQTQHKGNDTQNQGNDTQGLAGVAGGSAIVDSNFVRNGITDGADTVFGQGGAAFGTEHKNLPPFFMYGHNIACFTFGCKSFLT